MISRKETLLQAQPYAIAFRIVGKHEANCVQVISPQLFVFVTVRRTTARSLTIWFPPVRIIEGDWTISCVRIEIDAAGISNRIFTKEPTRVLIVVSGAVVIQASFGVRFAGGEGFPDLVRASHELYSKPAYAKSACAAPRIVPKLQSVPPA
jgi:hypothetical protein